MVRVQKASRKQKDIRKGNFVCAKDSDGKTAL